MAQNLAVVDMVDTIGATSGRILKGTKRAGIYLTGGPGIAWTAAEIQRLQNLGVQSIARIDQSNSVLSFPFYVVKDIEPGASKIGTAIAETALRARAGLRTGLYTFEADFAPVVAAVQAAGLEAHVDYWIADWNLSRDEAVARLQSDSRLKAIQWASPTSNPTTLVPGTNETLAGANVDLSVTRADWPSALPTKPKRHFPHPPKPPLPPKPHVKVTAAGVSGALSVALLGYLNSHGAHITHLDTTETSAISLVTALLVAYLTPNRA